MSIEIFLLIVSYAVFASLAIWNIKRNTTFFSKHKPRRRIFIDTSMLMDGRILPLLKTGFFADDFFIPRSVMRELQLLADSKSNDKRNRARAGMDVANELVKLEEVEVSFYKDKLDRSLVDERLLELAKKENGAIITMDFNLGKVAESEEIEVLNLNSLILSLRQEILNGERLKVKIKNEGSGENQGVGYLDDGMMVVVDGAKKKVGKEIMVEIVRSLQTESGKIWFAKMISSEKTKSVKKGLK